MGKYVQYGESIGAFSAEHELMREQEVSGNWEYNHHYQQLSSTTTVIIVAVCLK